MRKLNPGLIGLPALILVALGTFQVRGVDPADSSALATPITPQANAAALALAEHRADEAELRGNLPDLVQALNEEADGYLRAHEFNPAEQLLVRVLHLQEQHAGPTSLPVSDALLNLGWFYNNMARYETAQASLDRCLEIRQRLLGQTTAPVAEVLNALGALEENRSNYTLAEAFYEQAIAIREKVLGLQSPVTATSWNNLATLYWITGDYASAQNLFTQALAVREKVLGPNSAVVASTLNNLARLDTSLGDYDEAESYFQQALRIRTGRLGPEHPTTITTLSELGLLYVREGDDTRAEPLLVKAVQMREKTSQADSPDVARSLAQLGMLYDRRKLYIQAEPLLTQALEMRRRTLGTDHPEYAASLAALARHDHAQGRLAEALPFYEEALKVDRDVLGENHPETLDITASLACLKMELGNRADADALARDVAEAQQNVLNSVFAFAPERQRMDFEKTIEPCDVPAALGDADLLAEVVLRTKGVVLDSLLEDEAVKRAARDPAVREMLEKQRQLSSQLLRAQEDASGADFSESPQAAAGRAAMEQEEQELEADLAQKGISSGKTRRALETDVSDIQDALPDDAALVEFVAYNRYTGHLTSVPAYGAIILTRDGPCQWVPLATTAVIDAQVRTYQKYMRRRVHDSVVMEVLRGLDEAVCRPVVAALPAGIHRLIISPDGNLNFVSFATLLDPQGQFFAGDFDLNYVSSGRDLVERSPLTPKSVPENSQLVIFADPDYGHLPRTDASGKGVTAGEDNAFAPLPGTEREAAFLQQEARTARIGVQVYRGAGASKDNLAKQDSPYVLHLATHGLYLSGDDVPNFPASMGSEAIASQSLAAQSMSRSLLALAGASVTLRDWKRGIFPPPDNNGLLTAQEVAGLNLDHTWLVVLSACDTGSGEAQAGEGVLGLRRGFAEAVAQNLLITLWTVDDAETADLMEAFYREALRSGDAPGALARVQRASLEKLRKTAGLSEAVRKAGPFILNY